MELPLAKLRGMREDIDKYMWLRQLNASDTTLFHRLLLTQTEEILPFIYTPTVGERLLYCYMPPRPFNGEVHIHICPETK